MIWPSPLGGFRKAVRLILIVDDHQDAAMLLERLIRYAGHDAVSVNAGADALAMLQLRKPALMVLDVDMPGMDELSVLRIVKADSGLKDVRVVMYSADTHHDTMREARRLGAVDFLVKGTIGVKGLVARLVELAGAA
jgi:CheY-like chemotaxis protein